MCNVIGGEFIENIETTEIKYFALDEIPISAVMWIDGNTVPSVVAYAKYDKVQPFKGSLI